MGDNVAGDWPLNQHVEHEISLAHPPITATSKVAGNWRWRSIFGHRALQHYRPLRRASAHHHFAMTRSSTEPQLFDARGRRKYLQRAETRALLAAARMADRRTRLFCQLLYYTGCRISEALAVTPDRLDRTGGYVVFQTLKRRRPIFRAVPIPPRLCAGLATLARGASCDQPLFPWCRQTAWRKIKALMAQAHITGPQATAKGLRHAFGVLGIQCSIPESALARLMGHASIKSTQIYTFVTGDEERALVQRMW